MYYPFNEQRGAYKVLMRNRFIFVKNDLHPVMENIVLLHELGHDALHREEATKVGGFKEFEIFLYTITPYNYRNQTKPKKRKKIRNRNNSIQIFFLIHFTLHVRSHHFPFF